MNTITLFNVGGVLKSEEVGPYVMDPHPVELDNNQGTITVECIPVPINDGMMINIKVVRRGVRLGFLFADGVWMSSYCYRSVEKDLFKYDRIRIYSNRDLADNVAYAIVKEGPLWKLLKLDTYGMAISVEKIGDEGEDMNDLCRYIPGDYIYGCNPFTYTPKWITRLNDGEIFVFGSNKEGRHLGGAAKMAADNFGAQIGVGVGRTGDCYAIPTMDGSLDFIAQYAEGFRCYAQCHPELTFLVTRIGSGIAKWKDEEIAPLFNWGPYRSLPNVVFPKEWEPFTMINC